MAGAAKAFAKWFSDLEVALGGVCKDQKRSRDERTRKAQRSEAGKGRSDTTLTEEDSAWVTELVGSVATMMAKKTDERLSAVEGRVDVHDVMLAEVQKQLEEEKKERAALVAEIAQLRKKVEAAPAAAARSAARGSRDARPPEERTAARLGGLGWDTPELELVVRAKAALDAAAVDSSTYQGLSPACRPGGKGSACELHFSTPDALALARSLIRVAQHKATQSSPTCVWLDVQKSREELRPSRCVKNLHEFTEICMKEVDASAVVTYDQRTRSVSIKGVRAAYLTSEQQVMWTSVGEACLADEKRAWVDSIVHNTR